MTTKEERFKIVVGYDFSAQAEQALDRALWMASGVSDAEIHLVSGLTGTNTNADFPDVDKNMEGVDLIRDKLMAILEARISEIRPQSVHTFVHTWLNRGADAVLSISEDVHADLIIVGTHSKRGIVRAVLGSVSEKIVREAKCPVLVVRETTWKEERTPDIEPPCAGCVATRKKSDGATWWCEFHDHAPPYASPLRSHAQHGPEESRRMAWPLI